MTDNYLTISKPSRGHYKEKGSRFIAFAYPVNSELEINSLLSEFRKEHHNAHHICYAWLLYGDIPFYRANDDGEPSGTAGKPILGQINSHNLTNILIAVIRYFGGIQLGTGRLSKAYKIAAADALMNAQVITEFLYDIFLIRTDYENLKFVRKIADDLSAVLSDQRFDLKCEMKMKIRKSLTENFLRSISIFQQDVFQISKL